MDGVPSIVRYINLSLLRVIDQYHLDNGTRVGYQNYGPRRWLKRELGISWSSSVVQWMDATDEVLDGMLISDLSNLIKKYV